MLDSISIVRLYTNVLFHDMSQYNITEECIRIGVDSMREVYKADNAKQTAKRSTVADFNDVAHRCAYLHKYAALHTVMVRDMLRTAVDQNVSFFRTLVFQDECFKICSLGGGPGSDIIGVLSALHSVFSYFPVSVSVVDYMQNWMYSFHSILKELGTGMYGAFGNNTSHLLQWRYVGANLLKKLSHEVEREISTAHLVTMVKFVSAASCKDTEFMIKNIFEAMKPGAVLFFIDNDGGGFRELIMKTAKKYNFFSVFGPHYHENYTNEIVKVRRFGSVSCHKTTVSVHLLQKPPPQQPLLQNPYTSPVGHTVHRRRVLIESSHINMLYDSPYPLDRIPLPDANDSYCPQENFYPHPPDQILLPEDGYCPQENFYPHPPPINYNYSSPPPPQNSPLTPYVFELNRTAVRNPSMVMSPGTPRLPIRSRRHMGGCLPLSGLKHWRHHISSRFNRFKSRLNTLHKKKPMCKKLKSVAVDKSVK